MATRPQPVSQAKSSLRMLNEHRVMLVDLLEDHISSLMERLLLQGIFTRDDREEAIYEGGPRSQVRKTLDILSCKGEESATEFLLWCNQLQDRGPGCTYRAAGQPQSEKYRKAIKKHRQTLKRRSEFMLYYNTRHGEKILFSEHYINLLLVKGHRSLELKKHEFVAFGQQRISLQRHAVEQRVIKPAELFMTTASNRPTKKVLVTGVAGIGKTVLVQKILSDFGNDKAHLNFDFVIHLSFRDVNLIDQPMSLRDLLLRKNGHLVGEMDAILSNEEKLLIVLDGFDEFKHYRECELDEFVTEPDQESEVVKVLSSLMQGELLPEASVLLTSRPTAISYIPVGCIDSFVLLTGFSMAEIEDFFFRYFADEALALRLFQFVKRNDLLLTLCYIPAFCYIVCNVLGGTNGFSSDGPRTMTDIYTQYLVALLQSHSRASLGSPDVIPKGLQEMTETVLSMGKLAYKKLLSHETLFYGNSAEVQRLTSSGIVSTFLDKTSAQEPGYTEDVYSFAHFTTQEFFAALYYALEDQPSPDVLDPASDRQETGLGYLDLFRRFLSGLLAERNWSLLSRHLVVKRSSQADVYLPRLLKDIESLCESGAHILNHLHCFFEQQNASLIQQIHPNKLCVNVSNDTLSPMDYTALRHFLDLVEGEIFELDLTGTNVNAESLRDLMTHLLRCERLWLGENSLDTAAVCVLAELLENTQNLQILGLGWTDLGDEEFLILSKAMKTNQTLESIWMEGNQLTYEGLAVLADPTSCLSLQKVVAIWNNVSQDEADTLNRDSLRFVVSFTEDDMWEGWCTWVLQRCEVSTDEQLVRILRKVCNVSAHQVRVGWLQAFYRNLGQLIKARIQQSSEEDTRRKLAKFEQMLTL